MGDQAELLGDGEASFETGNSTLGFLHGVEGTPQSLHPAVQSLTFPLQPCQDLVVLTLTIQVGGSRCVRSDESTPWNAHVMPR